jgi:S-(hydroxymethyl)glutathione dehydrogenase/alcohol dehydrogenase
MKAAILNEYGTALSVQDVDVDDPAPDEVLIRTVASGVCHTDRTLQFGAIEHPLPLLLGHEVAGVVEAVGERVPDLKTGDHVVTCASAFCGRCRWCQRGQLQHCENKHRARPDGQPPRLSHGDRRVEPLSGIGGFAEQVLVHHSAVVAVPAEMPLDRAALLGCAVMTGLGAVRHAAKVRFGETVAVLGCGGVGLNVVQAARLAGAAKIIAIDRQPAKLRQATAFGATDTVDASAVDPVEAVLALTGVGVDHAIEVVGIEQTLTQAFAMLDTMGTLTVVGVARPDVRLPVPAIQLLLEKRIQGSKMGSGRFRLDVPLYARMYLEGRLMLDELISERLPLAQVNDALERLDNPVGARSVLSF